MGQPMEEIVQVFGTDLADRRADPQICLLYTSDAADERSSVDLGGRRIIKKKKRRRVAVEMTYRAKNK